MRQQLLRRELKEILYHVLLAVIGIVLLYPFIWLVTSSLKINTEIFGTAGIRLFPRQLHLDNYREGWFSVPPFSYSRFYLNTGIIELLGVCGAVSSSAFIAYGFARIRFRARNVWFIILLATMMLPDQVTIIPRYIGWTRLRAVGTYVPLILPWFFGVPFYIFLIRQFLAGVPIELDESARMDGATHFHIFSRILMPLCRPVLFVVAMFCFGSIYESFLDQLIYISEPARFTVALALRANIDTESIVHWGPLLAMTFVSLFPPIIAFLFAQKNLTAGIATTGLKG